MKTTHVYTHALILAIGLLLTAATQAAVTHITINTAPLISNAAGPFSLDLQFNDGGVLNNNTVTVGNFTFGGGAAVGSGNASDGGVTGDLGSIVAFNNGAAFQEFFQQFTPGSVLGFDVTTTNLVDGFTPDAFSVAILDKDLFNIPTNGVGNSLASLTFDGTAPTPSFSSGTGAFSGLSAAPEPSRSVLLIAGFATMFLRRRRK